MAGAALPRGASALLPAAAFRRPRCPLLPRSAACGACVWAAGTPAAGLAAACRGCSGDAGGRRVLGCTLPLRPAQLLPCAPSVRAPSHPGRFLCPCAAVAPLTAAVSRSCSRQHHQPAFLSLLPAGLLRRALWQPLCAGGAVAQEERHLQVRRQRRPRWPAGSSALTARTSGRPAAGGRARGCKRKQ